MSDSISNCRVVKGHYNTHTLFLSEGTHDRSADLIFWRGKPDDPPTFEIQICEQWGKSEKETTSLLAVDFVLDRAAALNLAAHLMVMANEIQQVAATWET